MFPCVCECVLFTMCHNSCFMMPTIDVNKSISSSVNKLLKVLLAIFYIASTTLFRSTISENASPSHPGCVIKPRVFLTIPIIICTGSVQLVFLKADFQWFKQVILLSVRKVFETIGRAQWNCQLGKSITKQSTSKKTATSFNHKKSSFYFMVLGY